MLRSRCSGWGMRLFILLQEIYSADIRAECPITSKHFQLLPPVKRIISLLTFLIAYVGMAMAQQTLSGTVVDSKTGEKLPFVNVVYTSGGGTQTDFDGHFSLPFRAGRLRFSVIGYETKTVAVKTAGDSLVFKIDAMEKSLGTAEVTGKKTKYSRKNNPAVELMRRVIAAKKSSDLHHHDYYSIDKYSKITFAFNEVTDKIFEEGKFKKFPFLKDHVEVCNETGKLILPISVDETVTRLIFRREPRSEKTSSSVSVPMVLTNCSIRATSSIPCSRTASPMWISTKTKYAFCSIPLRALSRRKRPLVFIATSSSIRSW